MKQSLSDIPMITRRFIPICRKGFVQADQNVRKGEKIARVGELDEARDAYIHFEIRIKGKARNPLFYLP